MPYQSRKTIENLLSLQAGSAGSSYNDSTSNTFYIPALFSCFEGSESYLSTNFIEPLILRVRTSNANAYAATDATGDNSASISLSDIELVASYINLPANTEQAAIQQDFGDGSNLSKVAWDLVTEQTDCTLSHTAFTTVTHEIKTNRVISELYFALVNNDNDVSNHVDHAGGGIAIDSVKIESNGQVIAELDGKLLGNLENGFSVDDWGFSDSSFWDQASRAQGTNYRYKFNFGLTKDTRRVFGCVSTRELNSFKLIVTAKTSSENQNNARLSVVMKSPMLLSISAESGRVTSSISS